VSTGRKTAGAEENFVPYAVVFLWSLTVVHFAALTNASPELREALVAADPFGIIKEKCVSHWCVFWVSLIVNVVSIHILQAWARGAYSSQTVADNHARDVARAGHSLMQLSAWLVTLTCNHFDDKSYWKSALAVAAGFNLQDLVHNHHLSTPPRQLILLLDVVAACAALLGGDEQWIRAAFSAGQLRAVVELLQSVRVLLPGKSQFSRGLLMTGNVLASGAVMVLPILFVWSNKATHPEIDYKTPSLVAFYLFMVALLNLIDHGEKKK